MTSDTRGGDTVTAAPTASAAATLPPLTGGQKTAVGFALPASLALAGMAFAEMFTAVNTAMMPVAYGLAWTIPIGSDVGMVAFSLLDMLFESLDMRARWMPWVPRLLICLQLSLNIASATDLKGRLGRSILPVVFVAVIEAWRWFYRRRKNLVKKSDRDKIPLARYLVDRRGSRELRRLMVLWDITDRHEALAMLQQIRLAEATLRRLFGPQWREDGPADLLLRLRIPIYMEEAVTAIRKLGEAADKKPAADKRPAAGNDNDGTAKTCCAIHRQIAANVKLELDDAVAQAMNAEHIAAHGNPAGAETLLKVFRVGGAGARALRDRLSESGPAVGLGREVGSDGRVGSVGHANGVPVGSVNGTGGGH